MKKIITSLSAVALATGGFALAGCGGVEDDPNAQETGESVEPGTPAEGGDNKDASGQPFEAGPAEGSQADDGKKKKGEE